MITKVSVTCIGNLSCFKNCCDETSISSFLMFPVKCQLKIRWEYDKLLSVEFTKWIKEEKIDVNIKINDF